MNARYLPVLPARTAASAAVSAPTASLKGDRQHPANAGRLRQGSSVLETLGDQDRLLNPEVDGEVVSWDQALDEVAGRFGRIVDEHGPDAVAFYVSGQLLTEDYYVANKLMKGYIGSANIDTNSRLCMSSAVVAHKRALVKTWCPAVTKIWSWRIWLSSPAPIPPGRTPSCTSASWPPSRRARHESGGD